MDACSLGNILATTTAKDIISLKSARPMIILSADDTLASALDILSKEEMLSAPVLFSNPDTLESNYLGFLDVFDVVDSVLNIFCGGTKQEEAAIDWTDLQAGLQQLRVREEDLGARTVATFMQAEHKLLEWVPKPETATVSEMIDSAFARGVRRIPIVDRTGMVTHVITQSDVVRLLLSHRQELGDAAKATLQDVMSGTKIISQTEDKSIIDAFFRMSLHHISAVGVVDANGVLIGAVSASDARGLHQTRLDALLLPPQEFFGSRLRMRSQPPIFMSPSSSLMRAVSMLVTYQAHRVWVLDPSDRPVGLVSLTDICAWLQRVCPWRK